MRFMLTAEILQWDQIISLVVTRLIVQPSVRFPDYLKCSFPFTVHDQFRYVNRPGNGADKNKTNTWYFLV